MADYNSSISNLQMNTEEVGDVAGSTSVVTLVAADTDRRAVSILNNSPTGYLYIDLDRDPTLTNAFVCIPPKATWFSGELNTGAEIRGIWDVGDGRANIREFK